MRKDLLKYKKAKHYMPTGLAKMKKAENHKCWQGCESEGNQTDTA